MPTFPTAVQEKINKAEEQWGRWNAATASIREKGAVEGVKEHDWLKDHTDPLQEMERLYKEATTSRLESLAAIAGHNAETQGQDITEMMSSALLQYDGSGDKGKKSNESVLHEFYNDRMKKDVVGGLGIGQDHVLSEYNISEAEGGTMTRAASPGSEPWRQILSDASEVRFRPLSILDVMPRGVATGGTIYFRMQAPTEGLYFDAGMGASALKTAEGAGYTKTAFSTVKVSREVRKVGHYVELTEEEIQDEAQFYDMVNRQAAQIVEQALEELILSTDADLGLLDNTIYGASPGIDTAIGNSIRKLETDDTAGDAATPATGYTLYRGQRIDAINYVAAQLMNDGGRTQFLAMNGTTSHRLRGITIASDDHRKMFPLEQNIGEPFLGYPVVINGSMPNDAVLMGDMTTAAQLMLRNGMVINREMTNSHGENFTSDIVAVKFSIRAATRYPYPTDLAYINLATGDDFNYS